jgi:hypothetical protein
MAASISGALEFQHAGIGLSRGAVFNLHFNGGMDEHDFEVLNGEPVTEPGGERLGDARFGHPAQNIGGRFEDELSNTAAKGGLEGAFARIGEKQLNDLVSDVISNRAVRGGPAILSDAERKGEVTPLRL